MFQAPSAISTRARLVARSPAVLSSFSRVTTSAAEHGCTHARVSPSPGQQSAHLPYGPPPSPPTRHRPPPPPSLTPPPRPQLPETRRTDDSRATWLLTLARHATCEGLACSWRSLARPPPGAVGAFRRSEASDAVSGSRPSRSCVKILEKEKEGAERRTGSWSEPLLRPYSHVPKGGKGVRKRDKDGPFHVPKYTTLTHIRGRSARHATGVCSTCLIRAAGVNSAGAVDCLRLPPV